MLTTASDVLLLTEGDRSFLAAVARQVLGANSAAATTAARLLSVGIDAQRIDAIIPQPGVIEIGDFVVKKIDSNAESRGPFELFVRVKRTCER